MAPPPPKRTLTTEDIPGAPAWLGRLLDSLNTLLKPTADALTQALTFRENFAGEVKDVEITAPEDWVDLATTDMRSGWQLYPSNAAPEAQFRLRLHKGLDGMVEGAGLAFPPTTTATGSVFVWPNGYAPRQMDIFNLQAEGQWAEVRARSGDAFVASRGGGTAGGQGWVSFSGMRFQALDRTPPRWSEPVTIRLGAKGKPYPGRPGSVLVLSARARQAPTAPVAIQAVDWVATTIDGSPAVQLWRVWGLVPGVAYSLRLAILPE